MPRFVPSPTHVLRPSRRDLHRMAGLTLAVALAPALARAAEKKEKKKGGGLSYIQFPPLETTLPRVGARNGVLSMEAGLDVKDPVLYKRADVSQPLLRDAYLRWLTIYAAALPPGAPPNPDEMAAELQRTTDRVLGRPGAKFLIGTVMVN